MNKIILALVVLLSSPSTFAQGQVCPDLNGVYRLVDRKFTEKPHYRNPLRWGYLKFKGKSDVPEISPIENTHLTFLGEPGEIRILNVEGFILLQFGGSNADIIVDGERRKVSIDGKEAGALVARCSQPNMINIFEDGENLSSEGSAQVKDSYESETHIRQLGSNRIQRFVRGTQWDQNKDPARTYEITEEYELVHDFRGETGQPIRSGDVHQGNGKVLGNDILTIIVTYAALLRSQARK